jgi:Protein of unknown function (DUF3489)
MAKASMKRVTASAEQPHVSLALPRKPAPKLAPEDKGAAVFNKMAESKSTARRAISKATPTPKTEPGSDRARSASGLGKTPSKGASGPQRDSKQARVIAMLHAPAGTTIAAMTKATGWQQHSVRGFLAGVVRKRLKLKLSSEKVDGSRVYRIPGGGGGRKALPSKSKRRSG